MTYIEGESTAARAIRISSENQNKGHDYSTWAGRAAGGIMRDLCDRGGIKSELRQCSQDIIADIMKAHTDIIEEAHSIGDFTNGMAQRAVFQGEFIRNLTSSRAHTMLTELGGRCEGDETVQSALLRIWWDE